MSRLAADTSIVVAAFARWHEHHDTAWHALERTDAFLAPCLLETFSMLTQLAADYLERIAPGAIHDALIATTAKDAGLTLATLDRRAVPTYERVGVGHELIAV